MQIQGQILSLAKEFIAIASIRENKEALHQVLQVARSSLHQSFQVTSYTNAGIPSLLIHNSTPDTKKFSLILNAHLDVVPGKANQFVPIEKRGKLYGRGAFDMKSAAAVMILVFNHCAHRVNYPLALQLVTDEETGSLHTTQYQITQGIRGDFVIAGENSNLHIKNKAKGTVWFTVQARGKSAHGGYPWKGENAIEKLMTQLTRLQHEFPHQEKAAWISTINVANIETGNTAFNKVPDVAKASIDLRYIPEDREKIETMLTSFFPKGIELTIIGKSNPSFVSETHPTVLLLKKTLQEVTGTAGEITPAHATSDIRFFNDVGCPGVEFGPKGGDQHGDTEYVSIDSLILYYDILKKFLLSLS